MLVKGALGGGTMQQQQNDTFELNQTTFIALDPSRNGTEICESNESLAIVADARDTRTSRSRGVHSPFSNPSLDK